MTETFALTMPLPELLVRATVGYFAMVFLVRIVPSRNAGHISPNDLLTLIVIGTIGSTAIIGSGSSIVEIMLMIGLVLIFSYTLDLLEHRYPALRKLLRHQRTMLIDRGRILKRNMRRELVTEEELRAVLRKEGIEDIARVRCAYMEADGEISVIPA
mgnify:CR=1 FL=1